MTQTFISLQLRNAETKRAKTFSAKLGISAFERFFQYSGRRLMPQAPFVVRVVNLWWNDSVLAW